MPMNKEQDEGFAWQVGVWDSMADTYRQEIDRRFGPVSVRGRTRPLAESHSGDFPDHALHCGACSEYRSEAWRNSGAEMEGR